MQTGGSRHPTLTWKSPIRENGTSEKSHYSNTSSLKLWFSTTFYYSLCEILEKKPTMRLNPKYSTGHLIIDLPTITRYHIVYWKFYDGRRRAPSRTFLSSKTVGKSRSSLRIERGCGLVVEAMTYLVWFAKYLIHPNSLSGEDWMPRSRCLARALESSSEVRARKGFGLTNCPRQFFIKSSAGSWKRELVLRTVTPAC